MSSCASRCVPPAASHCPHGLAVSWEQHPSEAVVGPLACCVGGAAGLSAATVAMAASSHAPQSSRVQAAGTDASALMISLPTQPIRQLDLGIRIVREATSALVRVSCATCCGVCHECRVVRTRFAEYPRRSVHVACLGRQASVAWWRCGGTTCIGAPLVYVVPWSGACDSPPADALGLRRDRCPHASFVTCRQVTTPSERACSHARLSWSRRTRRARRALHRWRNNCTACPRPSGESPTRAGGGGRCTLRAIARRRH